MEQRGCTGCARGVGGLFGNNPTQTTITEERVDQPLTIIDTSKTLRIT